MSGIFGSNSFTMPPSYPHVAFVLRSISLALKFIWKKTIHLTLTSSFSSHTFNLAQKALRKIEENSNKKKS